MRSDLTKVLAALSKLGASDRQAILKRLSDDERRLLAEHRAPPQTQPARVTRAAAKSELPCSPWLAKRLALVADEREGPALVTEAARSAVRALLAEQQR
jgi:hypothetical protein